MTAPLSLPKRIGLGVLSILVAAAIWLPSLHFFFRESAPGPTGIHPKARKIAARQIELWTNPELRAVEVEKMRHSNAEWDFMGRSYLAWALANMALRDRSYQKPALEVMDRIIAETLKLEKEKGFYVFSMGYAHRAPYVQQPPRSLFVDGEIAMMLAQRRLVEEREDYRPLLRDRIHTIVARMEDDPLQSPESYPDECWMFDVTTALAAIRIADVVDGADHSDLRRRWVAIAKKKFLDKRTGILVSDFNYAGNIIDGPRGSTIWMVAHNLLLIDPDFARDQYRRAEEQLAIESGGFGFSREFPRGQLGERDIDSGPVVPILHASASASGLALVAAGAFQDHNYLSRLITSLNYAAFPVEENGKLRYAASNQVGDAVLLYALTLGAVQNEVERRAHR